MAHYYSHLPTSLDHDHPRPQLYFGLTSCGSGPDPCCLMSTFASVGATSMDRQVTMTAYNAQLILRKVSHRMCSLRLDGPRDHVESTFSSLRTASPILSSTSRLPIAGGHPPSLKNFFASNASLRSLSFLAERALRVPDWLLQGLTSFNTGCKVSLLELLNALRQMSVLECFTLLGCTPLWDENDIFPDT